MALMQVNSKSIGSLDKLKIPNPDKLEKNSHKGTKTQRKNDYYKKTWWLGGENILLDISFANMM
jgi:hypothetical protein